MNKRDAMKLARLNCASLIDVNMFEDSDLWAGMEGASEEDKERFAAACLEVSLRLTRGLDDWERPKFPPEPVEELDALVEALAAPACQQCGGAGGGL